MSHYETIAFWVGINVVIAVFGPLIVGKGVAIFLNPSPAVTIRGVYSKGELGLVSLATALSVVFDIFKSAKPIFFATEAVASLLIVAVFGAWAWVVARIFDTAGNQNVNWGKIWQYSWQSAALVFSIGLVAEILLELATR